MSLTVGSATTSRTLSRNLSRGAYGLGVVEAELALTPPTHRAQDPGEAGQPVYDRFNVKSLRRALRETAAEPLYDDGLTSVR